MIINQLAVYSQNEVGKLLPIIKTLGSNGINIESLNIADTAEYGIVRMLTSDNEKAQKILQEKGFISTITSLVGVEVADEAGELSKTLEKLAANKIDIEYIYSYSRKDGKALILIKTEKIKEAEDLLK
ncbi:MAG: hypothetical protein J5656_01380 [Clostridia bacterium]|nr:hypothetical protein [Clostridia bacterium]